MSATSGVVILVTLSAFAVLAPALAQSHMPRYGDAGEPPSGVPYYAGDNYCVPQCREDPSPCDPLYFKQADGRCSGDNRRK